MTSHITPARVADGKATTNTPAINAAYNISQSSTTGSASMISDCGTSPDDTSVPATPAHDNNSDGESCVHLCPFTLAILSLPFHTVQNFAALSLRFLCHCLT